METLHPSEIELGLARIKTVADRLNINPSPAKVILVAGTNGKGSFVATLQKLLLASGASVGAYTSPHLLAYNERISINGVFADDKMLCEAFEAIDKARGEISLTYFEFGTLAAFLIFQTTNVAYWLCEIGLGGRLDAVNILHPDISVITSIDLDHQEWLGDTREKIAEEKCGILREKGCCIFADPNPPKNVAKILDDLSITPFLINQQFSVEQKNGAWNFRISKPKSDDASNVAHEDMFIASDELHLPPLSVAAALQAYQLCVSYDRVNPLDDKQLSKLLCSLSLAGRFQIVERYNTTFILDVAHNPAASRLLSKQLKTYLEYRDHSGSDVKSVIALVGMMSDKEIQETLRSLASVVNHWCVAPVENMPRSASAETLSNALVQEGVNAALVKKYDSIPAAFDAALSKAKENPEQSIVLCMGSFFTVSPILTLLTLS